MNNWIKNLSYVNCNNSCIFRSIKIKHINPSRWQLVIVILHFVAIKHMRVWLEDPHFVTMSWVKINLNLNSHPSSLTYMDVISVDNIFELRLFFKSQTDRHLIPKLFIPWPNSELKSIFIGLVGIFWLDMTQEGGKRL